MNKENSEADYLYCLRHSTAHVMAQAVQELFPETKITIGPPVEDGFYYDFDSPHRFTPEDLEKIESRMKEIAKGNHKFVMSSHDSKESRAFWEKRGEKYKVEMIDDLNTSAVSHCTHDKFVDLCRGNHVETTKEIQHFKLLKIAGAYWRGDEKREQLQRIYGTAWQTKKELDDYLKRLEEAKKRDHRELGQRLDLFSIQHESVGPGLVLWHPKGARIRLIIENFWREQHLLNGYDIVYTPHIGREELWRTSGHVDFYKEFMYSPMDVDGQKFYSKPMNCPFHIMIYKNRLYSYRDLPLRWAELGTVYRYEKSGVLHGLMRVRGFTQDDAHIICAPDQMAGEIRRVLRFCLEILSAFGFSGFNLYLATKPKQEFVGDETLWRDATKALDDAAKAEGLACKIDEGGGAFYGPKIDIKIKDALNREWQCSTIQFDFNLPERFDMTYTDPSGKKVRPYMIHRALLGSIERFFGVLIEHYGALFPLWLAPVQVIVLTITDKHNDYANEIAQKLRSKNIRAEVDDRSEKIGLKIREASMNKIPYQLIVGDNEIKDEKVSVRKQDGKNPGAMSLDHFCSAIQKEISEKSLTSLL